MGPYLLMDDVGSCVPAKDPNDVSDAAADAAPEELAIAVTTVGVTVADILESPVATVCVTLAERSAVATVCVTDGEADTVTDRVDRPVAMVCVTDCDTDTVCVTLKDDRTVATVCVMDCVGETDTVLDDRPVAIVGVTVTDSVAQPEGVKDTVCVVLRVERPVATVRVTDGDCDTDTVGLRVSTGPRSPMEDVGSCVPSMDPNGDREAAADCDPELLGRAVTTVGVTVHDTVASPVTTVSVTDGDTDVVVRPEAMVGVTVAVTESDAIVADALGVDPAGAQNGPKLYVARCVPSMELAGEAVLTDGDPVAEAMPVTTVCVTEGDTDTVRERSAVMIVGVTETVADAQPDTVRDTVTVTEDVLNPVTTVGVTDSVLDTEGDGVQEARPVAIVRVTDTVGE